MSDLLLFHFLCFHIKVLVEVESLVTGKVSHMKTFQMLPSGSLWWWSGSWPGPACWLSTAVPSAGKPLTEARGRSARLSTQRRAGKPYRGKSIRLPLLMRCPLQERKMLQQGPDSNLWEKKAELSFKLKRSRWVHGASAGSLLQLLLPTSLFHYISLSFTERSVQKVPVGRAVLLQAVRRPSRAQTQQQAPFRLYQLVSKEPWLINRSIERQ